MAGKLKQCLTFIQIDKETDFSPYLFPIIPIVILKLKYSQKVMTWQTFKCFYSFSKGSNDVINNFLNNFFQV